MIRKTIAAAFAALLIATGAACTPEQAPPPPAETSQPAELTEKQKHIVEDAKAALEREPFSEDGLKTFIIQDEGYSHEDVTAAVDSFACEQDWNAQAEKKAATYGLTDKEAIKSRLLDDGFTEEQAEYGANPVPQN